MKQEQKLSAKQKLFINAYLGSENATEAYKQAGYKVKNDNVAGPEASKLLRNPKVSQEITRLRAGNLAEQAKKREKIDIDQDWLISQLITTIEDSRAVNQHNVTRNAIMDVGKVLGLIINRSEVNAQLSIDAQLTQLDTSTLIQALTEARHPKAIEGKFHEVADD